MTERVSDERLAELADGWEHQAWSQVYEGWLAGAQYAETYSNTAAALRELQQWRRHATSSSDESILVVDVSAGDGETMRELDDYKQAVSRIHEYFGYRDEWRDFPIDDMRTSYWHIHGETLYWADSEQELLDESGNFYYGQIRSRADHTHIYRKPDYTAVVVDSETDLNVLLMVLDNTMERNRQAVQEDMPPPKPSLPRVTANLCADCMMPFGHAHRSTCSEART